MAIAPIVSVERSYSMYLPLADYLGQRLGRSGKVVCRGSYAEVNEMVRLGSCDLAFVCTYPFVEGRRDFGMKALAVPERREGIRYRSLIVVPADSPARSLADLKGRRFAYAGDLSTGGWLYPAVWLRQHGQDPNSFFSERVRAGSHDRALEAVAEGAADVAAVDSMVFDQVQGRTAGLLKAVRIIQRSEWFGAPPVVVSSRVDPALERALAAALLGMDGDTQGRRVLAGLGVRRFVPPRPGLYRSVEEMEAFLRTQP